MFNKKTLVAALLIGFAMNVQAAPLTVYGKLNVSAQASDEGAGSFTELKSNASRFGVKGDSSLDNDLTLIYQLEWEVDTSDEANEKNIKARDQFVGLKGSFGTIKAGRSDSSLKAAQGKIDLFNDYEADLKVLWKGENRLNNSLTYISPSFNDFSVAFSHIMEDTPEGIAGQSIALMYGDEALKDSKLFASVAMDNDVSGYDSLRLLAQYKISGVKVGAGVHQQESITTAVKEDGWLANVAYPMDKYEFKVQYQTLEDDNGVSAGVDYKLSKETKLFAWYSSYDFLNKLDTSYLAFGLEHKF